MTGNGTISIGCVVMAAGNAVRFGENKLSARLGGRTLIARALDAVPVEELDAVCVVTQYEEVAAEAAARGFRCVENNRPQEGLSRTVRLGTAALSAECDAIVYLVADQPLLRRESVAALLDFFRRHPEYIVGVSHGGRRGNPCVFPRRYFPELCALTGDVGGGAVIRRHEEALLCFPVGAEELLDVDTREMLEDLQDQRRCPPLGE